MARNGNIILAKGIGMDKEHKNIVNYSSSSMLQLLRSQNHFVGEKTDYSFISENGKGGNVIATNFTYQECKNANYIAFQNPTYYNKWIFAFIDEVTYENNGCTKITFTVDNWATWFDNLTFKSCFVVREHVNSDIIGEHTIPEGLETGEYIINSHGSDNQNTNLTCVCATTLSPGELVNFYGGVYNGIPSGITYYRFNTIIGGEGSNSLQEYLSMLTGDRINAVQGIFLAPKWLAGGEIVSTSIPTSNIPSTFSMTIPKLYTLDTYTPKNNKMLTYPYVYINMSNGQGGNAIYHQELWEDTNDLMTFNVQGCLTPGCSIRGIPYKYKGEDNPYDEGLNLGKFPQISWTTDQYTNWLTQNGVNINVDTVASILSAPKTGGLSFAVGIAKTMNEVYQHSLLPPQAKGNINSGDVVTSSGNNKFHYYIMSIKREYAKIIDDYFTRFGYKVNTLKVPNITGRTYWNYVEIGAGEDIAFGTLPVGAMEEINNIFRSGTTIWHNHDNIGNFNLDNSL
jgi:hypothetical protein